MPTESPSATTERDEAIASLNAELDKLRGELACLRNKVFGHTSEKRLPLYPNQLSLFDQRELELTDEEKTRLEADVAKAEETITYSVTRKARPSRRPLDDSRLPVEEEHLYPEGTTDEEGVLKDEYAEIGVEEKRVLETVPARVFIRKIIRHKVIPKSDVATKLPEDRRILTPALPPEPVERCIAGASVLTDIIIGKFMYHLPFYRQIQQYREAGITVSDSTMGGWYEAAVEKLKLLYDLLRKRILQSGYIHVDESVVPVMDDERHKTRKGYEWCVLDGLSGDVMFYYDRGSRAAIVYSLIGTCRNAGVDPRIWMEDVLRQIPYYRRDGRDMSELLPRRWKSRHEHSGISSTSHES